MKEKRIKLSKIKTTQLRTVIKILLWIMITAVFVKGAADIILGNTITRQREELEAYMISVNEEQELKNGTMAFAEEFVREYMSFDGDFSGDYETRISAYTAEGLTIEPPDEGKTIRTIAVNAVDVEIVRNDWVNVVVAAEIQFDKRISKCSLKVPVTAKNGKYAVVEYPQFIAAMEVADAKAAIARIEGSEVSIDESNQIESVMESFFKVYYGGEESELMYYVEEGRGIAVVKGSTEFREIESLQAFYSAEKDIYQIDVRLKVENSGVVLAQHLYLTAKKEGGRFYIRKIDTRI